MHILRAAVLLVCAAPLLAQEQTPDYETRILPILRTKCAGCHNEKTRGGGLDLSSRKTMLAGGDRGAAITPGDANESLLYQVILHAVEPHMPYKQKQLPKEEIDAIAAWIRGGALFEKAGVSPAFSRGSHWAFQPVTRPPAPQGSSLLRVRNPVDAFLAREQEKCGLKPLGEASPRVLARRLYVDLTGLPPTPAEMSAFLADRSPRAYESLVEKLLASPRYGERWGRHFLDIWRYCDGYGNPGVGNIWYSHKFLWRWRDWTVESLNEDKGYDRMVSEMLAGDELAPEDPKVVRATGYLARSWFQFNRTVWLQDTVEFTSAAFLGLTLKCARCHDHKYDPIAQEDYYRFRAFFEPHEVRIDRVPGEADPQAMGLTRVYDADTAAPTYRFRQGNDANPDKERPLTPAVPMLFGEDLKISPVKLPAAAFAPDFRPFVETDLIAQAKSAITKAETAAADAAKEFAAQPNDAKKRFAAELAAKVLAAERAALPALEARIAAEKAKYASPPDPKADDLGTAARNAERDHGYLKGQADLFRAQQALTDALTGFAPGGKADDKAVNRARQDLEAAAAALAQGKAAYTPIGKLYPDQSSGRRLALARWIASKDNPLTARVVVNHVWERHFGRPLVPTVFNFGRNGKPPSHPELLDFLASELVDHNWSLKHLHRLLVNSTAYRLQSSGWDPEAASAKVDPDNIYLWRAHVRRMEGEAIRDSMLQVAGQLDPAMGGPELDDLKGEDWRRRSLYFRHAPDLQMEMVSQFDAADPSDCHERRESVMPQQALSLSNSKLSLSAARILAGELAKDFPAPAAFVQAVFEQVLNRPPAAKELAACLQFLDKQASLLASPASLETLPDVIDAAEKTKIANRRYLPASGKSSELEHRAPAKDPAQRARESLVHALLNHNDFVTVR